MNVAHHDHPQIQPIPRENKVKGTDQHIPSVQPNRKAKRFAVIFLQMNVCVNIFHGRRGTRMLLTLLSGSPSLSDVSTSRQGCVAVSAATHRMRTSQIYSHARSAAAVEVCVNPACSTKSLIKQMTLYSTGVPYLLATFVCVSVALFLPSCHKL